MKLVDIDESTAGTFFRCLHDEKPEDPRAISIRQRWYEKVKDKGLRAKVLIDDQQRVVGLCQYLPIEHSHLIGEGLAAILCLWVHGYEHLVGNQQGQGYGKFMLEYIEADARDSGFKGIAAWGMDFPYWNPVSFYERMGYERVDTRGLVVLVWKKFCADAVKPELLRMKKRPGSDSHGQTSLSMPPQSETKRKINVTVFNSGWCTGGCGVCVTARKAVEGLDEIVDHEEVDTSDREVMLDWGIDDGVYVNGQPFRLFDPPWKSEELRQEILRLAEGKE